LAEAIGRRTGKEYHWNNGIMDCWNKGWYSFFHHSNIPPFHPKWDEIAINVILISTNHRNSEAPD
jgi:hypothetical protein